MDGMGAWRAIISCVHRPDSTFDDQAVQWNSLGRELRQVSVGGLDVGQHLSAEGHLGLSGEVRKTDLLHRT